MDIKGNFNQIRGDLSMKKYNITNILYQYVVHERGRANDGDENKCDIVKALYPSEYKKQLLLSTKKRLELISTPVKLINQLSHSSISIMNSTPLKVTPKEVIFQQYTPGNSYTTTIIISNTSKISHFVKLVCKQNEIFRVHIKGIIQNMRLAPGMSRVYDIQFDPYEKRDYQHKIDLVGDFETLTIPIIALGPRAILDFPDKIIMPETAVNIPSLKPILVRNVGDSSVTFTTSSSSSYFSIEPSRGVMKEDESLQFIIKFISPNVGSFAAIIYLQYETGELMRIDVYGAAFNCNIRLETEKLLLDDTFLGLSTAKSFKIYNDSNQIVKFQWMKYKDIKTDNEEKQKFTRIYDAIEDHRIDITYINSDYSDVFDSQTHETVSKRVHSDEITSLATENFLYHDSNIILTPMIGEIWPRRFADITVNFQPNVIGKISSKAFLEVTGYESRLFISFFGIGKGPVLKLNSTIIDIGKVYINSTHHIEIVCANEGLIPGTLIPNKKSCDFGGRISILPQTLEIQPGEYSSFNLSFLSSKNGEFIETVEFLNEDSSETLSLYIKGHIICPILYFEQSQLDLGTVALGFTSKHEVSIRNASSVAVSFSMSIPDDGNEPVIAYETFINSPKVSIPSLFPSNPREFSISPITTTLAAQSSLIITINFTPNITRIGKTCLKVIIDGSNTIPIILPILFNNKVALCTIEPSEFTIRFAFINFPYTISFTLINTSDVEGFFYLIRKPIPIDSLIFYSISTDKWYLRPGQSCGTSITIISRAIGQQEIEMNVKTFGKNDIDSFKIMVNGHGPVISILPKQLDFGNVEVLEEQSMSLKLINDSPIPANFNAYIANNNSPWSISITSGDIYPLKSMEIIVNLFLRDTKRQSDKIIIVIANGSTITANLCAYGLGSAIKIYPNIFPNFNIGQLLSYQDNFVPLKLTNEGNRWRKLIFTNTTAIRNARSVPQVPCMTTFKIDPHIVDLPPRSAKEIEWLIHSDTCDNISEQWWVYYAVQGQAKRELIGISNLSVTFVEPAVKFNKTELNFYINIISNDNNSVDEKIIDELEMINTSQMNLKVHLSIQYPFKIVIEDEERVNNTTICLNYNFLNRIRICFIPNMKSSKLYSQIFEELLIIKYDEHPDRDEIKCKGVVNYPNIIPIPRELQFDVSLNNFNTQIIMLNNSGPIPVNYQIFWIEKSIIIQYIDRILPTVPSQNFVELSKSNNNNSNENNDTVSLKSITDNEFLNEIINHSFEISPMNGIVLPYSNAQISLRFCAHETICLTGQLHCKVSHGPSEYIKIIARADTVNYSLDKIDINFYHQTVFKMCHDIINISNICKIKINYKIDSSLDKHLNNDGILLIKPMEGSIDPGKTGQLELYYQSKIPGKLKESFNLMIENMKPIEITIKCWSILPQVYIPLPHISSSKNYPIESEYEAIRYLNINKKFKIDDNNCLSINNDKNDFKRLKNNGWEIVSYHDDIIPEIMDIEMCIEKYLVVQYINENEALITIYMSSNDPMPIPLLSSPTYELNLGYAIIEQYTNRSIPIINYSSCKISIRIKKNKKDNYLTKYGIIVKFYNRINLMPNEFTKLDISIYPLKKTFTDHNKLIKRNIYIEVINGCTIPITIIANVTSPWLSINTNSLNFGHVTIGNSKLLRLLIKNSGLIDCQWKINLSNSEKISKIYFYLDHYQGHFSPGESRIINIYFKPQKSCCNEAELNIIIHERLEPQKVFLYGQGIDKKLIIDKSIIEFSPMIPYSVTEVHEFSIKNVCDCPIEFYWHHLDQISIKEDYIIKTLLHYYRVKEIVLPLIEIGSRIPQRLYDFYYSLIDEMINNNDFIPIDYSENIMISNNLNKSTLDTRLSLESVNSSNGYISNSRMLLKSRSPEEINDLLHSYIDKLHEDPDNFKLRNDPLKEIFNELSPDNTSIVNKNSVLKIQICIIFHGAPFTEYQETACRVATALNLSLINLNSAITEIIALGNSSYSVQIRQLIDDKYEELLQIAMGLTNNFEHLISLNDEITKPMSSINSEESEWKHFKKNIYFNLPVLDDPEIFFKNVPNTDDINSMKPLCRYEYKIDAIHLLQNIIDSANAAAPIKIIDSQTITKGINKSSGSKDKVKPVKTFLNIDLNILKRILHEIFNSSKYKKGFVIQTLNNIFIKTDVSTLYYILKVIGDIDLMMFITFHNSLELYKQKFAEKKNEIMLKQHEKLTMKLKMMDEMSSSDFELLPDDDKLLFIKKVLRPRINEGKQRRMKFNEKYELNKSNSTKATIKLIDIDKHKLNEEQNNKQENNQKYDKKQKKNEAEKLKKITKAFVNYKTNLKSIESMISNYFHIWHVTFSDPWDLTIYDLVIKQLTESQLTNHTLIDDKVFEPLLKPQLYSILSKNNRRSEYPSCIKSPFNLIELPCDLNSNENFTKSFKLDQSINKIIQPRVILKPNEIKMFNIIFEPTSVGLYNDKFELGIVGVNNKTYRINVIGKAIIPYLDMNPTSIFNDVMEMKSDPFITPSFFIDKNIFDFGYLLINENGNDQKNIQHNISRFNFLNSSPINVDVEFSLAYDNWEVFNFMPRTLSIKPNEIGSIQVTANTSKIGIMTDRLLLIIKNNPRIEEIILECCGCKLDVELNKKNISFGRVLLLRKNYKIVTLKNKSAVPLFWKILSDNSDEPQIIVTTCSDWTKAFSKSDIEICYHGLKIGGMKKYITLGIFPNELDNNPLILETIMINGETYDVTVDVNNANPINLNIGKIGQTIKSSFTIKNRGQNNINYAIEMDDIEKKFQVDRNMQKNINEDFLIDPSFGSLLPNKVAIINVTFVPKVELNLKEAPLYKCNLLDSNTNPTVVAVLPITVTIRSEYSRFTIEPYPKLFYGSVSVAIHKQKSFYIKNIGIFPIQYRIIPKSVENFQTSLIKFQSSKKKSEKIIIDNLKLHKIKTLKKKIPKKQKTTTKSDPVFLRFGPFTLQQNYEGTLDVNEIKELIIDFYSEIEGHFHDEISIFVDNCSIENENGRILNLTVDCYIPKLNFNEFNFIFHDSYVVNCIKDFICPSQIKPYSIFSKEEMCLYFERVIVSTTHTVNLRLYNSSLVQAEVSIQLIALLPEDSPSDTFTLDQSKLSIPPLNSQTFSISFTPTLIETYIGVLEIFVDLPSDIDRDKLSIKLFGEGHLAEIIIIQPEIFCKRGHAILEYEKCLVGETNIKNICFKNIGKICAKITTEIIEDDDCLYELKITDDINDNNVRIIGRHSIEVFSKPDEITQLLVLFTPKDKGKYESYVRLLIDENPYESLMINLNSEGYIEPVILIGLPLFKSTNINSTNTKNKRSNSVKVNDIECDMENSSIQQSQVSSVVNTVNAIIINSSNSLIYILDIGNCLLNEKKEVTFKIVNKTVNKAFRFQWNSYENKNIIIEPSIGHIYSLNDKSITVRFHSNEPVSYNQIPLDCVISEIIIHEQSNGTAWDNQHLYDDWIDDSLSNEEENIIRITDEADHEILNVEQSIQLLLSASVAYTIYSCSINEINFDDTFMFELREQKFELKNCGIVNLIYWWRFNESSSYHSIPSVNNSHNWLTFKSFTHDTDESLFRQGESLTSSTDLMTKSLESINNKKFETFKIEPEYGFLLPGQSKEFIVRFLPHNALYYHVKLTCNIENLNPEMPPLKIFINGRSLLPYYHFDIPKSNYSLNNEIHSVSEDVKIIEFKVIGAGKNYTKHFKLMNPTSESYHFSWIDKTSQNNHDIPYFNCKIQDSIAESGKWIKITFTFLARDVGVFEASWSFTIHEYNLEVPFLLVGIVTEPRVICCSQKITMPLTVLGSRVQSILIIRNNEEYPLKFKIIKNSVYSEGRLQNLSVEPMSGILSPQDDEELLIHFKPSEIGNFSFTLQCEIEKIKGPLKCFVTANVCKIESRVTFINSSNDNIELQTNKMNNLELGKFMLKNVKVYNFEIINMSDIAFEYKWNLNLKSSTIFRNNKYNFKIEMNDISGRIESKSRIISKLNVTALKKMDLKNYPITLKIHNGPLYKSLINATAMCAPIEFSFIKYNFGACYIKNTIENSSYSTELIITNNEDTFAIVECKNVPLPFIVNLEKISQAIPERTSISIPITFQPQETKTYYETLNFKINSHIEQNISLKGEGIIYKISLMKPQDKYIKFGNVPIGKDVKRRFTVINLAKASVKLKIGLIKKLLDTTNNSNISNIINESLNFEPSEHLTIRPNKTQEIIIKFSPKKRMNLFEEKIGGFCFDNSTIIPLLFIRGQCIAPEFNLNPTHLLFDNIAVGLSIEDKIILHNSGDIGAHFKWNIKKLGSCFSIKPLTGYSSPGNNITFNVYFHPIEQSNKIEGEALIEIENCQAITLLLNGQSIKLPDPIDTIVFSTSVRNKETKYIKRMNNLNVNEKIDISITGNYFQSENVLFIDGNSSVLCAITYTPLLMNEKTNPHEGTLVMKFSRRNSIEIFLLRGISLPPEAIEQITREIPEKIKYFETLPIYNWLDKPQYFVCIIKLIGNYDDQPIYTFNGSDKIEILANGMRNYQAVLCCYKGSILKFNIIFTNPDGEYQFYELHYKIIKQVTINTIELITTTQESFNYELEIENPFENETIKYSGNCKHPDIKIDGLPKILQPRLKESITIIYSPTIISESETVLKIVSRKLGEFLYKLKLKAIVANKIYHTIPEIITELGSSHTFNITITNTSKQIDEFKIKIDNSSFTCGMNKILILSRDKSSIEVTYEPCNIEIINTKIIVTSAINPEIIYNVTGNGIIPKPKGPFILTSNKPFIIPFKNVFLYTKTFKYIVNPAVSFLASSSSNIINSKQVANITVKYQNMNVNGNEFDISNRNNTVNGKLIVYCTDPELSSVNWIYYLKGI